MLQDKPEAGSFTFQVTLHQNGDIVFVYSDIPMKIDHIEDTAHPVKVGVSDAYIMDRTVFCECAIFHARYPNLSARRLRSRVAVGLCREIIIGSAAMSHASLLDNARGKIRDDI